MGDVLEPNPLLEPFARDCLTWFAEAGFGYFEVRGEHYDEAYFDRYAAQAGEGIGPRLMAWRCELVGSNWPYSVLDVGIGSGAFLEARDKARPPTRRHADLGFDVNPAGVAWLKERGRFADLYAEGGTDAATFWDVLEHIRRPDLALAQVNMKAFVSVPIFRDVAHVLASKHYRRDEHFWYWTRAGFIRFAEAQGFAVLDILATETAIGREDVETYVLKRIRKA